MIFLYRSGSLVRVEYGEYPQADAAYVLVYRPGLGFLWVEYGRTPANSSSWQMDGAGECTFEATYLDTYWISQGFGHNAWAGFGNPEYGFRADAKSTCDFNANATMLRMDAKSGAGFNAIQVPPPSGWKATNHGSCRFMGGVGQGEDCLTSDVVPTGSFPNFVY